MDLGFVVEGLGEMYEQAGLGGTILIIGSGIITAWVMSGFKMPGDYGKKKDEKKSNHIPDEDC